MDEYRVSTCCLAFASCLMDRWRIGDKDGDKRERWSLEIKLFFSSYNPFLLRFTIAHKMKKVKEVLTNIEKEGCGTLDLVPQDTSMWADEVARNQATISPTNGGIDIIRMVGRDTEKKKLIKLLKSEADEVVSIIPIPNQFFFDSRTKTFDLRVWVYVSKKFDLQRIGEIIISTVSRSTSIEPSEWYITLKDGNLQSITEMLKSMLPTKKYLIVLDDMWEEGVDNLEKLKHMLQYGRKGSKIILTTRMQHVVDKLDIVALASQGIIRPVRKSDQINLSILSDDDCWNVMRQTPFWQDEDLCGLEAIGRQIAKKCAGLPLLARSLGFLLSQHKSTAAWEDIMDKKIILGMEENTLLQEPLERLMLSYYYMPLKFKLCFTYCAVYAKGFTIASDNLIQQWRALGYIQSIVDGKHCVDYLLGMSFLQISKTSPNAPEDAEGPIKVTMHDLVYDLATIILGQQLIAINDPKELTQNSLEKNYCRHMQFINYQKHKIRSLHFTECDRLQLQDKSFSKCKYLRVLDISECSIQGKSVPSNISLPSSIHQLMLLRYLDASGLPITSLPKSLHKLQNMQTLILSNCALETLPNNIGSLLNLCYLDLSGNSSLNKLPVSFGELSALWFLNLSACSKFYELPESIGNLISLRHLDMSGCNVLQKLPDKFGTLPNLLFLNLSSCSKLVKQPDSINIKSLEHLNLSSCHQLQSLPNNFGNLENLMFLNLSDCYNAHMLPESFCRLKHLKDLDLSDCHDLKELPKCFGNLSELHSLNLTSCSKLQSLPESFGGMSKLKRLDLSYCIRLENLPSSFRSLKLQVLYMLNLHELPEGISNMTSLIKFEVHTVKGWDIDFFGTPSILRLPYRVVEHIVHEVHEVGYWPHSSIVSIGKLACQHLRINHLEKVKHSEDAERAKLRDNADLQKLCLSWGHEDMTENKRDAEVLENLIPPRTLEGFTLRACDAVPQLGMLPNLRLLLIILIPNITKIRKEFYGEKGACKRLRVIQLYGLKNMEECWTTRSGEEGDDFLIPNLHMLDIWDCPKLKFLSYPPKSMYWDLTYGDEVLPPMHEFGRLSSSTLPFEAKIRSKSFTTDKWDQLQHLATLEELSVTGFHSSLASFPEATPWLLLYLPNLEILPEWLGQLIALEELFIWSPPKLTCFPESIWNLTTLKRLSIRDYPRQVKRCKGEDAHKISRIPEVEFDY
ncbi:hypothetical protein PVAP13_8NG164903 [Panicum virgatum]|uniref:NB-ARC domain-containing protein n=1 Tax=Panicum virgatum TaxID=38727 RepID=A0A8T0PFF7_PANVG|nr:hypothetical protein PVAP13_8NG164903 [Panicum virgatum]